MTTKSAIYVLDSSGKITQMFVSESGFSVNQYVDIYTFSSNDITVPVHVFNVSDQCTPDQTVLSECLNKTTIVDVTQPFGGNVLYLLIPEISLTKYSVATGTDITMTQEGQITVQVSTGSVPEITDLSSTQVEPEDALRPDEVGSTSNPSIGIEESTTATTEPDISSTQVEPETSTPSIVSGEHEIVRAFNLAKSIADSITQPNSSDSTATTASMTSNPWSWSKFG